MSLKDHVPRTLERIACLLRAEFHVPPRALGKEGAAFSLREAHEDHPGPLEAFMHLREDVTVQKGSDLVCSRFCLLLASKGNVCVRCGGGWDPDPEAQCYFPPQGKFQHSP